MARHLLAFWALMLFALPNAFAQVPEVMTYEGFLTDNADVPVESAAVLIRLQVQSDNGCLLYQWDVTKNMTGSGGHFNVSVGGTDGTRTDGLAHSLADVFSTPSLTGTSSCTSSSLARRLVISTNISGGGWNTFAALNMTSSPSSMTALKVGNTPENRLIKTNTTPSIGLTQASLEQFFQTIKGSNGASAKWDTGTSNFIAYDPADGAGLTNASVTDAKINSVSWSKLTSIPATLSSIGALNCSNGEILLRGSSSWSCSAPSASGLTSLNGLTGSSQTFSVTATGTAIGLNSTGSVHTLNVPLASGTGVTSGTISKADYDNFSGKQASGNYITSLTGDVTAAGPGAAAATLANNAVTSAKILDGTIATADLADGSVTNLKISSLSISKLTNAASTYLDYRPNNTTCADGEVLQWSSVNMGWICGAGGGGGGTVTAVTATLPLQSSGGATPNLTISAANNSTNGYLTNTDWAAFNAKLGPVLNNSMVYVGNGSNVATAQYFGVNNLRTPAGISQFTSASCLAHQTLSWSSLTDTFNCVNIVLTSASSRTTVASTIFVRPVGVGGANDGTCNGTVSSGTSPNCPFATLQRALDSIPEEIAHNTTIDIEGSFTLTQPVIISKRGHYGSGALLTIGSATTRTYLNSDATPGQTGIAVMPSMQNLKLREITLSGFLGQNDFQEGTGLRVDGGTTLLKNISLTNNQVGISVNNGGRAFFVDDGGSASNSITLASTNNAGGISMQSGDIGSTGSANVVISASGDRQNMLRLEGASAHFSGPLRVSMTPACQECKGVELSRGARLATEGYFELDTAGAYDSRNNGIRVSNSSFYTNAGFVVSNWSGSFSPLVAEEGGRISLYGTTTMNGGGSNSAISIRQQSTLRVGGSLTVQGSAMSLISVQGQSSAELSSYGGTSNWSLTGNGSNTGIQVSDQSLLRISTMSASSPNLSIFSLPLLARFTGSSRFTANYGSALNGSSNMGVDLDGSSTSYTDPAFSGKFTISGGGGGGSDMIGVGMVNSGSGSGGSPYQLNMPGATLQNGKIFTFIMGVSGGTASPYMSFNGGSASMIYNAYTNTPLIASDLVMGRVYRATFNGSNFRLVPDTPTKFSINVSISVGANGIYDVDLGLYDAQTNIQCSPRDSIHPRLVFTTFSQSMDNHVFLRFLNTDATTRTVNVNFQCSIL